MQGDCALCLLSLCLETNILSANALWFQRREARKQEQANNPFYIKSSPSPQKVGVSSRFSLVSGMTARGSCWVSALPLPSGTGWFSLRFWSLLVRRLGQLPAAGFVSLACVKNSSRAKSRAGSGACLIVVIWLYNTPCYRTGFGTVLFRP